MSQKIINVTVILLLSFGNCQNDYIIYNHSYIYNLIQEESHEIFMKNCRIEKLFIYIIYICRVVIKKT